MRFTSSLFITIFLLSSCAVNKNTTAKGVVTQSQSTVPNEHGLWYYLPKTVVRVEVTAEKEVVKTGAFYRFSQRFLNISDVITEDKEEWRITGAKVSTFGVPDETKLFRVSTQGAPAMAAMSLTENGILQRVNIPHEKRVKLPKSSRTSEKIISLSDVHFNDVPFTEEQLIKSSTTAMAEEVAKEIYRLRQIKNQMLKGDIESLPPDAGAYKITFEEIEKQENAYLKLFTGIVEKQTVTRVYEFVPDDSHSLNTVLLRFSPQNGFLENMDVSGTPVYIEIEVDTVQKQNYLSMEDKKSVNTSGLAVCNPATGKVKIIDRTLLLAETNVQLGQFGQLYRLPADLLDNTDAGIMLDDATGAVKEIIINK
ncbi:MAG: DUF4831 family protein [Cytophagaceae bacterium]|jgi:hypothetical protein|nr:DUF4831 family protein [Cytophagaceae bacterium]